MAKTETLGDALKKIALVGVGAAAITAEKSKELVEVLAKKGEEAVEQGKALNEELKHNRKEKVTDDFLDSLTPEQMEELKGKIIERESEAKNEAEAQNEAEVQSESEAENETETQRETDGE